jgi:hypothetical protein
MSVASLGGPDNAIIIPDSAPPPVPTNPGPPLWLTPLRLNPKAPPGLDKWWMAGGPYNGPNSEGTNQTNTELS